MQDMKILTDAASDQQIASPHIAIEIDRTPLRASVFSLTAIDTTLFKPLLPKQLRFGQVHLAASQCCLVLALGLRRCQ